MFALFRKFVQIYKMHRLILGLLPLFFLASACKQDLPEGILSEQQMAEVMSEVHILDGYISNLPTDSAKKVIEPLYDQLLANYGLDSVLFTKNVNYYLGNPVLTQRTYDRVVKNLEHEEKAFITQDSLTHALSRDSMRRVQRFTKRANLAKEMITKVSSDTLEMTIAEGTRRLYETTGVWSIWESYVLRKPTQGDSALEEIDPEPADAPSTDSTDHSDLPEQQQDTVSHHPKGLQFKPVGGSRR